MGKKLIAKSTKTCGKLYKANKMKKEDAYLYDGKSTVCVK